MRESVYEDLRRRLLTSALPAGTLLREVELAADVGASRTPVREALVRLRAEGLLVRTAAGLAVREFSEHDIMEVYEVRVPLEALAARLAAERVSPLHVAQIEALRDKFAAGAQQRDLDAAWLAKVNLELHRAICQGTGNALLFEVMSRIYDTIGRFSNRSFQRPERVAEAVLEHEGLVAAIAQHEPDRAEQIARQHLRHAMEHRLEIVREMHRRPPTADRPKGARRLAVRRRPVS
jgi:DNA-binding GntR family transcriptional regulator